MVSHAFTMGQWHSNCHEIVTGRSLYLWIVSAAGGTWRVQEAAGGELTLQLTQEFQRLQASAQRDGKAVAVPRAACTPLVGV